MRGRQLFSGLEHVRKRPVIGKPGEHSCIPVVTPFGCNPQEIECGGPILLHSQTPGGQQRGEMGRVGVAVAGARERPGNSFLKIVGRLRQEGFGEFAFRGAVALMGGTPERGTCVFRFARIGVSAASSLRPNAFRI